MAPIVHAQSESVLFYEQGLDCEVLWATLDAFAVEIQRNPTSIATVEISGKADDRRGNFYWDSMIRGYFVRRSIPGEKWRVKRTTLGNERRAKFWLTPVGAPPPKTEGSEWSFRYPAGTKPFIFTNGKSYSVEIGVCLDVDEIALLAKALESNPSARVNVVLIVRSAREYQRRKRNVIKTLKDQYSVAPSRIKTFKKISTKPNPYGIEPNVEYWFVP